ncbi:MAG: hypothetical protein IJ405_03730 [Lachnospiraceae bacterium]|nr:hypothetical protein [Lachnospiraceae bacterium]
MAIIKFTNNEKLHTVTLTNYPSPADRKRVKLCFSSADEANKAAVQSGFVELNEHNHIVQSDFSNMTFVYQKLADNKTFILSDTEGDIYVAPVPVPEPEPHVPTLEELKQNKIWDFSMLCSSAINNGVALEIDGEREYFSYTDEDQRNIKEIFDLAIQTKVPMYYHANGKSCKPYSVEQIVALYFTASMNKMHHQTYFNQMKMYILSLNSKESVEALVYAVSELTGEYLDVYNAAMEQAKNSISVLLNNAGLSEV